MRRRRYQKGKSPHYLVLINKQAANYSERALKSLLHEIRKNNGFYTTEEAESKAELLSKAEIACGLKGKNKVPPYVANRGPVTAAVAVGGDTTVNLAAQVAVSSDIPIGILPLGRHNNIARSLLSDLNLSHVIDVIRDRNYHKVDLMTVGERLVVGSLTFGFLPQVAKLLDGKRLPRMGFRWSALGARAAEAVNPHKLTLKIDAFRIDVSVRMFAINLLPYALGMKFSPTSMIDDKHAEVIFDIGCSEKELGHYLRGIAKDSYVYGSGLRLFRGYVIHMQPVNGKEMLFDGEPMRLDEKELSIKVGDKQVKIFC